MKLPVKLTILILLFAGHFLFLQNAIACTCRERKSPCEEYGTASLVFSGKVIQVTELFDESDNKDPQQRRVYGRIARFQIDKIYKGNSSSQVEVHSGSGMGDCGFIFSEGYQYVVYAYDTRNKSFWTDICTRTRHIKEAKSDLAFLNGLSEAEPGGTIYGTVELWAVSWRGNPMPDVQVKIQKEDRLIATTTDKQGQYRVNGIAPGNYKVSLELPVYLGTGRTDYFSEMLLESLGENNLMVADRGCAKKDFTVRYDGRISGKVVDAKGQPLKEVRVEIIETENAFDRSKYREKFYVYTNEKGIYEFKMLQPSHYILGINIENLPDFQTPYRRIYFPGVSNIKKVRTILMRGGDKLKGYNFRLLPQIPQREIKGTVLQADGKPIVGAKVALDLIEKPNFSPRVITVDVDAQGKFVLKGLHGLKYKISAYFDETTPKWRRYETEPIQIVATKNMQPLTLKFFQKIN